jgi:6-phosphofructokinase
MPSIVIAQGGGPTAVINQTLCGALVAARRHDPSLRILGARYGVRGLTKNNVVDLSNLPEAELRRLGNTPNSALGSTRDKPARRPRLCLYWRQRYRRNARIAPTAVDWRLPFRACPQDHR